MPLHSIVIPVYNEAEGLNALFDRMKALIDGMGQPCEVILVNDGSRDGSTEGLNAIHARDSRFKVIHLSRNFGHQVAITAGIEWASGDTVSVIDADLQDPPELIRDMIRKWEEGYEVVYAVRRTRVGESAFKLFTAKVFYRLLRSLTQIDIPVDTGDFRLMDRKVVEAYLSIPERNRYVRGLISWVGFKQIGLPFDRADRKFGETHYPFKKMLKFAIDGITSFSVAPLRVANYVGFVSAVGAMIVAGYVLYQKFVAHETIPGWTSLSLIVLFLGGAQLFALGMLGEYIGRIFDETRKRPLYLVGRSLGFKTPIESISRRKAA